MVDPTLTLSCPADVSAHVGLDTLCQVRVCMYIYSTIALTLLAAMYVCMGEEHRAVCEQLAESVC